MREQKQSAQPPQKPRDNSILVLGAGVAGLRCAQQLSHTKKIIVVEKRKHCGGLATSFPYKNFILDIGPHKIYSILPGIMQQYKDLLGDACLVVDKKNSLLLRGYLYRFPIQPFQLLTHFNPFVGVHCGLSYARTLFTKKTDYIISYEDYFLNGFGKAAYELLFKDIANKVWGDPKTLSADLAERRIPVPSIVKLMQDILTKKTKPEVSAAQFYYPKKGMGAISEHLLTEIKNNKGAIVTETTPTSLEVSNSRIVSAKIKKNDKEITLAPETVVSTIHLIDLINLITPTPPAAVVEAVKKLKYRSLIIVYLIVKKSRVLDDHWIFFPERTYIFTRVAELKNFSTEIAPSDKTVLTAEVGCAFEDATYKLSDKELYEHVITDLEKAGLLKRDEVEEYFNVKINRCYPVYEIGYKDHLNKVLDYIDSIENLYVIGRQGLFNYNNTDHSIDMANKLSQHILSRQTKEAWTRTRQSFDDYRIVD